MQNTAKGITNLPEYKELYSGLQAGASPILAVGLSAVHKALLAAALRQETSRPILLLTDDDTAAMRLAADLEAFSEQQALVVPPRDFLLVGAEAASRQYEQARLRALWKLSEGVPFAVASAASVLQATIPPEMLKSAIFSLRSGDAVSMNALTSRLTAAGYSRCAQVEGAGQFSVRGGIFDVFPPQEHAPVRIEFWGDDIDSITYFDVGSQRRGAEVETLVCLPCREALPSLAEHGVKGLCKALERRLKARRKKHPNLETNLARDLERLTESGTLPAADKYLPDIYPFACLLDYLPANTLILLDDTPRLREAARGFADRMNAELTALTERGELPQETADFVLPFGAFSEFLREKRTTVRLDAFLNSIPELAPKTLINFAVTRLNPFGGAADLGDIQSLLSGGQAVAVVCSSALRCKAMLDTLLDAGLPAALSNRLPQPGQLFVTEGSLSSGFELPGARLTVLVEGAPAARRRTSKSKKSNRDRVKSYTDLTPGDLVVHEHHGIGRFVGMERMKIENTERDFVKISFAGTDFLYVPATNLDLISKYIGGEPEKVRLTKLGGTDWAKARSRAKASAKELAGKLIQLYAERARQKGFAFPADDAWQREFEDAFRYEETDDQLKCVAEIKADMESDRPMDRLLCGDVGFGKTEVALRAVMKCVLAGKQAAILAPTTVLARQHFLTATERFSGYPLRIELLSRYRTSAEQKKIMAHLQDGYLDLVIGTHKLMNKAIRFHDLGLLVIDEEQRFGVAHKEALKAMAKQIDVLTLSATPIPRTLNMALSGIRDMSAIEEPPHDRHPVQTFVMEYSEPMLIDAMRRELARGGQVYYLHNFVESIDRTAARIGAELPDARIGVAHGKMGQRELADVMNQMNDGEIDILVCTTIIETGVDIPNVNTLIIENADNMGLAQLHQIRGRVGRSSRHAYAYLTYRRGKALSEDAQKRLAAIREFAEFGSGFKIAMRDLEIRGAGNVLGSEQSGHMMTVGYDLYLKLLEEAVLEEKGEPVPHRVECAADLTVNANLTAEYVSDPGQRIDLYRRIALIHDEDGHSDLLDELIDRYGEPPAEVVALLDVALLRAAAANEGITEIRQNEGHLLLTFENADFARLSALCANEKYRGRLLLNAGSKPYVSLRMNSGETQLALSRELVALYAATKQNL